jgi:hypothetical protein
MQDVYALYLGLAAIAGITAMEIMAIAEGMNGKRLATAMTIVGAVAGFAFGVGVS